MTIVSRPSRVVSLLGGSIKPPVNPCTHGTPRFVEPWRGEPGTAGRAVVVGAGKMGLPLAVQFARHGWNVTAVDVNPAVVDAINAGRSHVAEEPGLAEGVAEMHDAGRLHATTDAAEATRDADVAVLIVPVTLDDGNQPNYRYMDAAVDSIGAGIHAGLTVIFETTLPVGDTRGRFTPRMEAASGLKGEADFLVAFSPERLYSGAVFRNLATEGLVLSDALFKTLTIRYLRVAQDAVKQYEDDAAINGLPFDRHQEMLAVRAFTNALRLAADEYLRDPLGIPLISNWNRVTSAIPDFFEMLKQAVDQDCNGK